MALLLALATAAALAEHAAGQMLSMPATRCPAAGMQQAALDAVTRTCCAAPARCPNSGMPSACSQACSDVFTPLYSACGRELDDNMPGLRVFATLCPVPSLGHGGKVCGFGANAPCPAGSRTDRSTAAVIAAFTADAASMPFHWIYSGAQITRTVGRGNHPEFYASPQVQWYHYRTGALSPFGEQGMVYLRTLTSSTNQASSFVDPVEIAAAYNSYYSGSGTCASSDNCYHDTCTRGFVANMAAGRSWPECGANDDQDEAITHLIPVVALLAGRPEMLARAKDAVRVIQNTDRAQAFGLASARLLESILLDATPRSAITDTATALRDRNREFPTSFDAELAAGLERALAAADTMDPAAAAGQFGNGCDFPQPLLLAAHMVARLANLRSSTARAAIVLEPTQTQQAGVLMEAVRQSIYQGGDNAGRGQFVAAMMAAAGGMLSIPDSWVSQLEATVQTDVTTMARTLMAQRSALDNSAGTAAGAAPPSPPAAGAVCVDDPSGAVAGAGQTCPVILPMLGSNCDFDLSTLSPAILAGTTLRIACPLSCNDCPTIGGGH